MSSIEKAPAVGAFGLRITTTEWRALLASVVMFVAAACVPLVFGGYVLQVTISS